MTRILLYSDFRPPISDLVDCKYLSCIRSSSFKIGYIPSDSDRNRRYFNKIVEQYEKIGISNITYFDLGEEYDPSQIPHLMSCDAIHLSGGEPQQFLNLVKLRNFSPFFRKYLNSGGLLVGVSAGAMILSKSLGLLTIDHPTAKPDRHPALNFFPFEFYPHYCAEESLDQNLASYARQKKIQIYACDDDSGIYLENNVATLIGKVRMFSP